MHNMPRHAGVNAQISMSESDPFHLLRQIAAGYCVSRSIHALAELKVADALGDSPLTAAELAKATGTDPDALYRVLRLACAHGVFELEGDRFRHSPASRMLRSDHPQSMRSFTRMFGLAINWEAFAELEYSVRTGRRAMEKTLPEGIWTYLEKQPEANRIFNAAMLAKAQGQIPAIVASYDFSQFNLIGDIAGGRGHLLSAILEAAPKTKGVLFDLSHVVKEAAPTASERLKVESGDFFKDPLPRCDGYILMEIIHDWPDKEAVAILQAVRRAATPQARLLLIETIVPNDPGPDWSKMLDIHMLTLLGGKQRTLSEYESLLEQSGFSFHREIDTGAGISILEAIVKSPNHNERILPKLARA
jgi:O-methyltransferase domain